MHERGALKFFETSRKPNNHETSQQWNPPRSPKAAPIHEGGARNFTSELPETHAMTKITEDAALSAAQIPKILR